ncbi:MAG: hypothetical protein K1W22_05260 [Lachnospiraceae bacterium]
MTRSEKKEVIESMAEQFMSVGDNEGKSMIIMVMSAYMEGKAAGKQEERAKWERQQRKPELVAQCF